MQSGVGLARLVILAPRRRLEVALPERLPLSTLLPGVLRHAGEDLPDEGLGHEGWVLRRTDGSVLETGSTLAAQQVRDGETLHLTPRRAEWPEPAYDDIVEAIAAGSSRRGARWTGAATRVAGLSAACAALAVGLANAALAGPPWAPTAAPALAAGALLVVAGVVLSRVLADATAGAVVAAAGMPFAFLGGLVLLADEPLTALGAPHVLTGSALLLVAGLLGYLGVAEHGRLFVAGAAAGACGVVGAAVAYGSIGGPAAAALLAGALLLGGPALPALAVRLGQIPLPALPRAPDDLVRDEPLPDRRSVYAATARADEILIGLLLATALVTIACIAGLAAAGGGAATALAVAVSSAHLLRARFYAAVRHRAPLLLTGSLGLGLLGMGLGALATANQARSLVVLPVLAAVAAIAVAAGLAYSRRPASPRLGRAADILDVLLTLAVVPLAAGVLGLFGFMRGLGG